MRDVLRLDQTEIEGEAFSVEAFTFPDGTRHIKIKGRGGPRSFSNALIVARPKNSDEFIDIILANDTLKSMGYRDIQLSMPYVLGSRQDRVQGLMREPLSADIYASMINSCGFSEVHIWEPHSDVTPALIKNCRVHEGIGRVVLDRHYRDDMVLIAPDVGATKRVTKLAEFYCAKVLQGMKDRDPATGKLSGFSLICSKGAYGGRRGVIVDDCLTNGGTFWGLRNELIEWADFKELWLVVTHADHETGVRSMSGKFDKVFISNSRSNWKCLIDPNCRNVNVVKLGLSLKHGDMI